MLGLRGKRTIGDALYDVRADLSRSQRTIGEAVHNVRDDLSRSQRNVHDALRDATTDLAHVAKTGGRERYKRDLGFWPGFISGCFVGGILVSVIGLVLHRRSSSGVLGYRVPSMGLREEVDSGMVAEPHNDREKVEAEEKREFDDRARDIQGRETAMSANEPRETVSGSIGMESLRQTP